MNGNDLRVLMLNITRLSVDCVTNSIDESIVERSECQSIAAVRDPYGLIRFQYFFWIFSENVLIGFW